VGSTIEYDTDSRTHSPTALLISSAPKAGSFPSTGPELGTSYLELITPLDPILLPGVPALILPFRYYFTQPGMTSR